MTDSSHGTRSRYVQGCRCDQCRGANTEYIRGRREQGKPVDTVDELRRTNPAAFTAAARRQIDDRPGIEDCIDGVDICGDISWLGVSQFVCANPPGHADPRTIECCGHRYVHDTRQGQP